MNQDEVNQRVRSGEGVVTATSKLRAKIIARSQQMIDGTEYVTLSDLLREIQEISSVLLRQGTRSRKYAVALASAIANSILLALLLIPDKQARVADDKTPKNSAEASAELERTIDEARSAAHILFGSQDSAPSLEDWERERAKSKNAPLWEQLLTAPRTDNAEVYCGTGAQLLEIPPVPRTLSAAKKPKVSLKVKTVDEDSSIAIVNLLGAENPDDPSMKGLFDRRIQLTFDQDATPGIAKFLELAQVTDTDVTIRATVTRGLGTPNARLDSLGVSEVIEENAMRQKISYRLVAMRAVSGDLFDAASVQ